MIDRVLGAAGRAGVQDFEPTGSHIAAARVIETQPTRARSALVEVETASRETLSGLRRMLGVLRQAEPGHDHHAPPLAPVPGLADVDRLAAATTAAGVRVDGRSSTEIAADLTISIATVKTYVTRLLAKLDARDRVHLVIIAYETGLVAPAS